MNNIITIIASIGCAAYITAVATQKKFYKLSFWAAGIYVFSIFIAVIFAVLLASNKLFSDSEFAAHQRYMLSCAYYEGAPEGYLEEVEKKIDAFNKQIERSNWLNNNSWTHGFGEWAYYGLEPIDVKELTSNEN